MKICTATLRSTAPYSASRLHEAPKLEKEGADAYEQRTWREKGTFDANGMLCIPAMGLKMAVDEAAKRLAMGIPGRGKSTYTKFFVAGQICIDTPGVCLNIAKDDLDQVKIWANADGVRGSGKRVKRLFPLVHQWKGNAQFAILDPTIPPAIFEKTLIEAGRLIGVGRFRPEKGGMNGRFAVDNITWAEEA